VKNSVILLLICTVIPASIRAQDVDYKIPKQLDAQDFQLPKDREFLRKFDEVKIPALIRRMLKTKEKYIVPWLRQHTADAQDYELTIKMMRKGVLVTEKQFTWVKTEVNACAEILHISPPPRVFIVGGGGMKAHAVNFKDPFIILPSELIEKSNAQALRFAIGRQMGHIKCDHVFYKSLTSGGISSLEFVLGKWGQELINAFLGKISDLILVDWILARELSADRAGLIACQDLKIVQKTLLNFKLAIPFEIVELNVEDYLEQTKIIREKQELILENLPGPVQKGISRWQRSNRLASDYPFMLQRIAALQKYAESEAYQKLFE
jgi:Zn-dependent protease with chaperone function